MTTTEVADQINLGRRSTYERLERLVDHGQLETKKVGGNGRVWWQPATMEREPTRELNTTDDQFQSLINATEEYAIFILGPDGYVLTWNSGAEQIKGYAADEIVGKHFSTFYTDDDRAAGVPETNLTEAARNGSTEDEGWRVQADGSTFWANVTISAIWDDDGALEGYTKVTRDMTDRRKYERRLEAQTERLKRQREGLETELDDVFERISDGFYALDDDLRFMYLNDQAMETLNVDEPAVGTDIRDEVVLTDAFDDALYEALETQEPVIFEDYYEPANGWFHNAVYPSDSGLSVYFREITQEKERKRELERRANQQQTVADLGQFALETDDLDELMDRASRQVADVLDNEYCKVLDLNPDAEELLLRQGIGWHDGIVGEATVSSIEADSQAAYTLANAHPIVVEDLQTESRFSGPELLTSHDVRSGISTIICPFNEPWGILGTHDTERREYSEEDVSFVQSVANILAEAIERHQYQQDLEQLVADLEESNERLEQFAYAASHDLQEPLRMVSSYLQLLEDRYGDAFDEDAEEFLEFAIDGAERMRRMIDGLLQYSRIETEGDPLELTDLDSLLDEVLKDLQLRIEETDADVTSDPLPRIKGDASQLRQVLQNLVDNAIEYSRDEPPCVHISAKKTGDEWIISVHDEGIGIDPGDADRVFEVFNRLHSQEKHDGTGIGLALCKRIVERHGGDIWVDSEPGEGATFSFTLSDA